MQARLIQVSAGVDLTMPHDPSHYENGRRIEFPPPGVSFHYGTRDTTPQRGKIDSKDYGLLILDDWIYMTQGEAPNEGPIPQLTNIEPGENFAKGLQAQFATQGLLLIKGELPTEEEITRAKRNRQRWAAKMIELDRVEVELGRAGHKGHKPFPGNLAEELRREYGMASLELSRTATQPEVQKPAGLTVVEDTACPMCSLPIAATAQKCRHCQTMFGMSVMDYLTQPPKEKAPKATKEAHS